MTSQNSMADFFALFVQVSSLNILDASQIVIAVCGLWALGWGVVQLRPDESRRTD